MTDAYAGDELWLFSHAKNWKRYWFSHVRPYLGQHVLEVGAGIGTNTAVLNKGVAEWICLEPNKRLAAMIERQRATRIVVGTLADIPRAPSFDSIVYIDVLEHIEDDASEVAAAAARLVPNGTLIVLAPAHGWLFSAFDRALGHYRRYSPQMLRALTVSSLELICLRQLDSVGVLASVANRLVLKSTLPTLRQILIWDRAMVPLSRLLDPLLGYRFGRSIIAVWRRR